jgi:hypothetical protein
MGVPQMIGLFAIVGLAWRFGASGVLLGLLAAVLIYLIIGAAITMGRRR